VKRDAVFWQAVQAVIARAAAHWGDSLEGRALLTLSRDLQQIELLAPESPPARPRNRRLRCHRELLLLQ
jgi:hypothetical protein